MMNKIMQTFLRKLLISVLLSASFVFANAYAMESAQLKAELKVIGEDYLKDKDIDRAIQRYTQLQQLNPSYTAVMYNLGRLYEIKEDWEQAVRWYNQFLLLEPNSKRAEFVQGKMTALGALALNDKDPSRLKNRLYEESVAVAQIQYDEKKFTDAIVSVEEGVQIDPNRVEAYLIGGLVMMEDGDCKAAIGYFQKAENVAVIAEDKTLISDAIQECSKQQSYATHIEQAESLIEQKDFASAAPLLHKAWESNPSELDTALMAAMSYYQAQDYTNSKVILKTLLKAGVPSIAIEAKEMLRQIEHQDVPVARSNIGTMSTSQLSALPGGQSYLKGLSQIRSGKHASAERHFSDAINKLPLKPEYAHFYIERAKAKKSQKKYDDALNDLDMARILNPRMSSIYALSGSILYDQNKYHEAFNRFSQGVNYASDIEKADLYFNMGTSRYQTGDYEDAVAQFTSSLSFEKSKTKEGQVLHWRGASYRNIGEEAKAIKDLAKSLKLRPNSAAKDDLQKLKDNWLIVMSKGLPYHSQSYFTSKSFPSEFMLEQWADGKKVTHLSHGFDGWFVVAAKGTSFGGQIYKTRSFFPKDFIQEKWDEGFLITEVAHDGKNWTVMMSKNAGLGGQTWRTRSYLPEKEIKKGWDDGYRIQDIDYGKGTWSLVLATRTGYGAQTYRRSKTFPTDFITEKRDKGFYISHAAYGQGEWMIVMSKGRNKTNQAYRRKNEFDKKFIKDYWGSSYDIDLVIPVTQDIE